MTYRPTVRGRRLARELRKLREEQGLTLQEVADRLDWSRATVSRLETSQTRPRPGDIADILDLYGVPSPARDALITLARQAGQRGWWTAYQDVFTGSYVALEDEASHIRTWDPQLIHGLLQIEQYSRAVITAGRLLPAQEEIERRIAARTIRQALLDRENAPKLHVIFDESVLHRQIGGPEVMRAQLEALNLAVETRPFVCVQVLPYTAQEHAGLDGRFTILSYPNAADPDIAYVEGTMGDVYLESAEEIAKHRDRFDRIEAEALSPEDSAHLIAEAARSSP
ncbi:helix-turn-helix domain-containing protein [Actinomadura terrae]|uniref:helix-turn-helix domain-containing protein n=1 Tax=Actinomadura terrae TaxID=604353 RepID=UPI001FA7E496|nr:helix-turn-helix transcriptional regulator [Actinomadura terrae]